MTNPNIKADSTTIDNNIYVLSKLKKYFQIDAYSAIFVQIIEVVSALFAGGFVGAFISDPQKNTLFIVSGIAISSLLFVGLTVFRLFKSYHFPETAISFLESQKLLSEKTNELDRKDTIDTYIDEAIKELNSNTCPLTTSEQNHLCDSSLEDGIKTVLRHIISHTHYFLDCSLSKYSIFIHLKGFPKIEGAFEVIKIPITLTLRDDYCVSRFFTNTILRNTDAQNFELELYKASLTTSNNRVFIETIFDNLSGRKMLTSPIPSVCEDNCNGILYIVCDSSIKIPQEIENVLLIFSRVVSNWISKYEDCINTRKMKLELESKKSS